MVHFHEFAVEILGPACYNAYMEVPELMQTPLVKAALAVVQKLRDKGYSAVFAGGCVRDLLMGLPVNDVDIATEATPNVVQDLFTRTVPVGVDFGVVIVIEGDYRFEVATFRSDSGYSDGRHPDEVRFSSIEEDVKRRDFTINGMMYDPLDKRLIDLVHGREDIDARIVRAIGDPVRRFEEDKLRILRAIRFSARFCFNIETHTLSAVRSFAQRIDQVSVERIGEELCKMLTHSNPARAVELMSETALLKVVLPEVADLEGVLQDPGEHPEGDAFTHTLRVLDNLTDRPSQALAFAALFHDIGKAPIWNETHSPEYTGHQLKSADMVRSIARRLKFSNQLTRGIVNLVREHALPFEIDDLKKSDLKKRLKDIDFDDLHSLLIADFKAFNGDLSLVEHTRDIYEELVREGLAPEPFITGDDLLELGVHEGPELGRVLDAVYDAQLDCQIATRDEAFQMAEDLISRL